MPAECDDATELRALIRTSNRRPIRFGVCFAPRPENTVLILHRLRKARVLGRQAKVAGRGAKTAFGTLTTSRKTVSLNCDDPVPGMEKRLKRYLALQGLTLRVRLSEPAAA